MASKIHTAEQVTFNDGTVNLAITRKYTNAKGEIKNAGGGVWIDITPTRKIEDVVTDLQEARKAAAAFIEMVDAELEARGAKPPAARKNGTR